MTTTTTAALLPPPFDADAELGAVINDLLFRRRTTHTALAGVVGVTQSTMSKKLRGQVGITPAELFSIADALDTSAANLIEQVERARRDSNPKPSDWERPALYLVRGGAERSAVRSDLTADRLLRAVGA